MLDDFTLYWLTNTRTSSGRLYWENRGTSPTSAAAQKTDEIALPVAITVFPNDDLYRAPETWSRRAYSNLIYFHEVERGGHFAAWEEPELFAVELRAAFRSSSPVNMAYQRSWVLAKQPRSSWTASGSGWTAHGGSSLGFTKLIQGQEINDSCAELPD